MRCAADDFSSDWRAATTRWSLRKAPWLAWRPFRAQRWLKTAFGTRPIPEPDISDRIFKTIAPHGS